MTIEEAARELHNELIEAGIMDVAHTRVRDGDIIVFYHSTKMSYDPPRRYEGYYVYYRWTEDEVEAE